MVYYNIVYIVAYIWPRVWLAQRVFNAKDHNHVRAGSWQNRGWSLGSGGGRSTDTIIHDSLSGCQMAWHSAAPGRCGCIIKRA